MGGSNTQFQRPSGTNGRDILDQQRYARGELTRGKYEAMKQDLQ